MLRGVHSWSPGLKGHGLRALRYVDLEQPYMKLKSSCCKKFRKKAKACKSCPIIAVMPKKLRRKTLKRIKKKLSAQSG